MERIPPVLKSLQRLPLCQRVDFKLQLLLLKALNGLGPKYISDLLRDYKTFWSLRLSVTALVSADGIKLSFYPPYLWNSLKSESSSKCMLILISTKTNIPNSVFPYLQARCCCSLWKSVKVFLGLAFFKLLYSHWSIINH